MGKHFTCSGSCGGVAEMPTVCGAEDCDKKGEPLMECKCEDGSHNSSMESEKKCEYCGEYCQSKGGCAVEPFKPELES